MKGTDTTRLKSASVSHHNRFPQTTEIFGKPTAFINKQGIQHGFFINKSLNNMTLEELFHLAEEHNTDPAEHNQELAKVIQYLEDADFNAKNELEKMKLLKKFEKIRKSITN